MATVAFPRVATEREGAGAGDRRGWSDDPLHQSRDGHQHLPCRSGGIGRLGRAVEEGLGGITVETVHLGAVRRAAEDAGIVIRCRGHRQDLPIARIDRHHRAMLARQKLLGILLHACIEAEV